MEIITKSEKETKELGKLLSKFLKPGDIVLFYGDLGTGKTTMIQGICEGLEVNPNVYITSPTFSIMNYYEGKYPIIHIDLYRISSDDLEELGIWENISSSIYLIEWAEKISQIPSLDFLEVKLDYLDVLHRKITLVGYGEWSELLLKLHRDLLSKKEEFCQVKP